MEYILTGQVLIITQDGGLNQEKQKENKEYQAKIHELEKLFSKAKAYESLSNTLDLKMESMKGYLMEQKVISSLK